VKRNVAAALGLALTVMLGGASCSPQPESSGTNTNWLKACESSAQCGATARCLCGLCTEACVDEADCAPGTCGTALATASQCDSSGSSRICLPPTDETCTELVVPRDLDFAATPAPGCDVPGALLCEGFDAPLPPQYATWYSEEMTTAISDCRVHQGAGAMHYQAEAFGISQTRMRLTEAVSSGLLAARFYLYVPSRTVIPDYLGLFEFWDEDQGSSGKISVEAKPEDRLEVQVSPDGDVHRSGTGALVRDRWMCVTLTLDLATPTGSITLAVDGSSVVEEPSAVTLLPNPISIAVVEGLPSSEGTTVDVTIDELVVASQPLECP
jgi:hypothetical protein